MSKQSGSSYKFLWPYQILRIYELYIWSFSDKYICLNFGAKIEYISEKELFTMKEEKIDRKQRLYLVKIFASNDILLLLRKLHREPQVWQVIRYFSRNQIISFKDGFPTFIFACSIKCTHLFYSRLFLNQISATEYR